MTNLEGRRVFGEKWKEMDETHLHAYLGLLILAGVYKSKDESTASLWDADTGPNVTVDERLVAFRGHCPFKQYMPSKPAKYGIKIWAACDANSSYALNLQVYTGKPIGGAAERNQGMRVVLDMAQALRGHNITCDNFLTSYNLGQELLKKKLTMVGTVRKNRTELSAELLAIKNRAPQSSKLVFTDTTALVSYCPKKGKNVLLMSTLHKNDEISTRGDHKPNMILDYNATKGGVDNLDKVTGTYSTKRMTARWPLVIFFNIIDVSAYKELGKALVVPHIERRQHMPRTPASAATVREIQERATPSTPVPEHMPKLTSLPDILSPQPGEEFSIPSEVGLTELVNQQGGHPNVIRMHEWFDAPDHYVMVLEWPDPCLDLNGWTLLSQNHALDEAQAQPDVKPGNILINTDTLRVILIDFWCGDIWKDTRFYGFAGPEVFMAPQWHWDQEYLACPATMCLSGFTFSFTLAFEEENRPTLQELLLHPWLRSVCLQTASERSTGDERGVKRKSCIEEHEIPVKRSWKVSESRDVQRKRSQIKMKSRH
ncbi:hypothetical protein AAFF_G00161590 [Aldrovandia affinis]|uniref:Protein kinase domain-containing protein n=1 Tax=Aldrovandia affinis TaxID=143900 RepID=A0AAD7W7S3_9TELE|nr:hypothetical protein AAFF_G00161590 [Aldrovandia affinis]